jgi:hypothetical protein
MKEVIQCQILKEKQHVQENTGNDYAEKNSSLEGVLNSLKLKKFRTISLLKIRVGIITEKNLNEQTNNKILRSDIKSITTLKINVHNRHF